MVGLGDLSGGPRYSEALAVSGDGTVVAGVSANSLGYEAFRWTANEGMIALGDLPGGTHISEAYSASGDGSIIVGYSRSSGDQREAFRWAEPTGMTGLGFLPGGTSSIAHGVSADGSTIVGSSFSSSSLATEAFRWTESGGMVGLGDLGGDPYFFSVAKDVSADGSVIAGNSDGEVFVWDETHGMRSLRRMLGFDLTGWGWIEASGISDDGSTIVGYGWHPENDTNEAWIAVLPEPSTLALLALGSAALLRQRRFLAG